MHCTRVKICGLTSPEDASAAVLAGADAVGVVFADGPRQVNLARAREILHAVPTDMTRVGVFVNADRGFVAEAAAACGLGEIQFHGEESPEYCAGWPIPVVKTFPVVGDFDPSIFNAYEDVIAAALLDAYVSGVRGGSGHAFSWDAVGVLPEWLPVIVAGGLNPTNVGAAIEHFEPFGVDVASGVEEFTGHKDRHRMAAFVAAVREAEERLGRQCS